ncbi:MAG: radical SAM protein [Candidatus Omnitrophota bacterium]
MDYYRQLHWVDEYIKNVKPYIYVREEDHLLIKIPNEAHKLNEQAVKILKHLLQGQSIYAIVDGYPDRESVARDLHHFFCDLRAMLKGCFHEQDARLAVEKIPFHLPFNTLPVLSEIAITYRCNLECQFCYASCGCSKKDSAAELPTNTLKKILSMIRKEIEIPSVSFTGGEPTLRQDLPELIRFAKELGLWTNLITNATLIDANTAKDFQGAGLDSAQVSLEAGTALVHDQIVGSKGAFELTLEGLKNLREAGIRVHTNTTISGLNKNDLLGLLDLIAQLGFNKFSMNMLMPEGSALSRLDHVFVSYSEIGDIVLEISHAAQEKNLEFMWYSPTPLCIFNPIIHGLGNKGCAACDGLLSIAPNGDILPCSSFPQPMGNILEMEGRFKEIWKSPAFAYFQEKRFAHALCQECNYLAICNGGCPLYFRQVGYREIMASAHGVCP